jgi:hypothetical protein
MGFSCGSAFFGVYVLSPGEELWPISKEGGMRVKIVQKRATQPNLIDC